MSESEKVEFYIHISATDSTEEDIDRLTRDLLSELRQTDADSVKLVTQENIPDGAKAGDVVTPGAIIISTLPTVLPAVITVVQGWITREPRRSVKFKGKVGKDEIEFEGPPEELHKIIDKLTQANKK